MYNHSLDRPFIVRTDASQFAIAACIAQLDEHGLERPIAFASAKLSPAETRYSVIEKESLAVIFALKKFDGILYGCHIDLYTDHNPLKYVVSCAPSSAKLTRWALSLSRYDITIHHIKGKDNFSADFLTRC